MMPRIYRKVVCQGSAIGIHGAVGDGCGNPLNLRISDEIERGDDALLQDGQR